MTGEGWGCGTEVGAWVVSRSSVVAATTAPPWSSPIWLAAREPIVITASGTQSRIQLAQESTGEPIGRARPAPSCLRRGGSPRGSRGGSLHRRSTDQRRGRPQGLAPPRPPWRPRDPWLLALRSAEMELSTSLASSRYARSRSSSAVVRMVIRGGVVAPHPARGGREEPFRTDWSDLRRIGTEPPPADASVQTRVVRNDHLDRGDVACRVQWRLWSDAPATTSSTRPADATGTAVRAVRSTSRFHSSVTTVGDRHRQPVRRLGAPDAEHHDPF